MNNKTSIRRWINHKLDSAIERRIQRLADSDEIVQICIMPDVHLAGDTCNGVVIATKNKLFPQAVGGDIGCGYLSAALDVDINAFNELVAAKILSKLKRAVPVNKHSQKRDFNLKSSLSNSRLRRASFREGGIQLGTLGRGNHFVEFQCDSSGQVWLLIHSGSRSMGQLISAHHLNNAELDPTSGLAQLEADSNQGQQWLNDQQWAREYAAANRITMLREIEMRVLPAIGAQVIEDSLMHRDHNHIQYETHAGVGLWVHRKGAQRLPRNEVSVIPGSMGATTFVVQGRGNADSLDSCSHGAGRQMSRKEASNRLSGKVLLREMRDVWFDHRQLYRLVDESPSAYKDIRKVMKAQRELVRIIDRRQPVLNYKG